MRFTVRFIVRFAYGGGPYRLAELALFSAAAAGAPRQVRGVLGQQVGLVVGEAQLGPMINQPMGGTCSTKIW